MSCCPNLDSEDFLIRGAWHLVASSYTKLVNAQLPRLHQHEHVTVAPENNREPSMGRWGIATAPACRDQVCERSVSLAVLSASWSACSSLFVLLWACKPARWATHNKHQNIDFIEERTSPRVKQKSSCACVFMCICVCVCEPKRPSLSHPLPFGCSSSSSVNINEWPETQTRAFFLLAEPQLHINRLKIKMLKSPYISISTKLMSKSPCMCTDVVSTHTWKH